MPFSGEEVVDVLTDHRFEIAGRSGSHVKLQFIDANTGEKRVVSVPMHDEVKPNTLRSIAEQAGAKDFQKFKNWLKDSL